MLWREDPAKVRPMLATLAEPPLKGAGLVFEPKYDGIRALVHVVPRPGGADVRLWSRLGNEKTTQFPSIVRGLERWGTKLKGPVLLDGEIVALDENGAPAGFQRLQGRIHLTSARDVALIDASQPVALIAFDLLRDDKDDVRGEPLTARRVRLQKLLGRKLPEGLRLSEQVAEDGRELRERAGREGWEGLIVKEARAPYQSGRRSPSWRKLKIVRQQEFVIGGWTEPRQTRQHFGALLLGVRDENDPGKLKYVGHTGTGFNGKELARVSALLTARETKASPFSERIKTNEPAHWTRPELVAEIRFTEWTDENKLRHPVYLGLRDDKKAADVVKEAPKRPTVPAPEGPSASINARGAPRLRSASARLAVALAKAAPPRASRPSTGLGATLRSSKGRSRAPLRGASLRPLARAAGAADTSAVVAQLHALEDARRDGTLELPDGGRLAITNPAKPFWPKLKLTKGDLFRYYATVAPYILPAVQDRPLVMKRFPNGIEGKAFYQQRSRLENPPPGVRIETIADDIDPISEPDAQRLIGGSLISLLYMTQIAAISQDPWFSRVQSPLDADYVAIDLDPGDGTTFATVLEVARLVHEELDSMKVPSVPKTSGSSGLHIYIPLAPGTTYESGMLFCQIVATVIATRHPKIATVERTVRARRKGTVYVDYLQNILGKTLATAYSARASDYAGVSTPLEWKEVFEDIDPRDFTIQTAPARFKKVGDLWGRLRTSKPADLERVFKKYT